MHRAYASRRILVVATHDVVMAGLSFGLAVYARFALAGEDLTAVPLWEGVWIFAAIAGVVFWRAGLYRGIWHYASLNDLVTITRATALAVLVFLALQF